MPGVATLLDALDKARIKRCVVTHSPSDHVEYIRKCNPELNSIPHWFTREHYSQPKPNPECYLKAIAELGEEGDAIIGFEDTPRGLSALQQSPAQAVFLTEISYPNERYFLDKATLRSSNFNTLSNSIIDLKQEQT
jgi:HAD superfamily hydrolase (TIGR01509 family)